MLTKTRFLTLVLVAGAALLFFVIAPVEAQRGPRPPSPPVPVLEEVASSTTTGTQALHIPYGSYPNKMSASRCSPPKSGDMFAPWLPAQTDDDPFTTGDTLYQVGNCSYDLMVGGFDPVSGWISSTSGSLAGWMTAPSFLGFSNSRFNDTSAVMGNSDIANGVTEFPSEPIWASSGNDDTDYNYLTGSGGSWDARNLHLYSSGSTLFRQVFTMNEEDINDLTSGVASLKLEAAADDFYMAYINGIPIAAKTYARTPLGVLTVSPAAMKVGQNVLSFQVIDKALWKTNPSSRAAGFRFSMYTSKPPTPPASYVLTPSVTTNPANGGTIGEGGSVRATPEVVKAGTDSAATDWQLSVMYYDPGVTPPNPPSGSSYWDSGGSDPKTYFEGSLNAKNLAVLDSGTGRVFKVSSDGLNGPRDFVVPAGLPAGTRVCFSLSVDPFGSGAGNRWRHSELSCLVIENSREPKVQIQGGDLRVNGDIVASTTNGGSPSETFGSWVEYGVFASGDDEKVGSGSGLSGGSAASEASWRRLTFANTPSYGDFGALGVTHSAANYFRGLSTGKNTSGALFDVSGKAGVFDFGTDNVAVSGNVGDGNSVIIITTGRVTIESDITYPATPISGLGNIPQLVIVAGSVNINPGVGRVDAWLLVSGTIDTCAGRTGNQIATDCNNFLVVNGPVMADRLDLKRSAGADMSVPSQRDAPAELFRMRPDAYLWAHDFSNKLRRAQTVYLVEAPPRF